jgi:hypothetical protein
VKTLPVTGLFRKLVPVFRYPPVILKPVPKGGHDVHWRKLRKLSNERQGTEQKLYAAFGTIFRISKSFKEASRNFSFFTL